MTRHLVGDSVTRTVRPMRAEETTFRRVSNVPHTVSHARDHAAAVAAATLGNVEARPRHPSPDNAWTPGCSRQRWPGPCVCRPRAGPLCWVTVLARGLLSWRHQETQGSHRCSKGPHSGPQGCSQDGTPELRLCVPRLSWHLLIPWGRGTAMGDMPERLGSWCPCSL